MSRTERTDEELKKAVGHLRYEIGMLGYTARQLLSGEPRCEPASNVLIESYGIHCRVLTAFLYKKKDGDDGIVARDYLAKDYDWEKKVGKQPDELKDAYERVNKWLAHLTTKRINESPCKREWHPEKEVPKIKKALLKFSEEASSDLVGTGFGKYVLEHLPSDTGVKENDATIASFSELPLRNVTDDD